jgi:hypothetical protein
MGIQETHFEDLPDTVPAHKILVGPRGDLAAKFVAADQRYLMHADDPALSVGDIYWDMVVWVKPGITGINQPVVFKGTNVGVGFATGYEYVLFISNTGGATFVARKVGDAAYMAVQKVGAVTFNAWNMIHVYYNPDTDILGISVNAGAYTTAAATLGILDAAHNFQVGYWSYNTTPMYYDGDVGPLALWKPSGTNLTQAQITWLYNGGIGRDFAELGVVGDDGQYLIEDVGVNHPLQTWWQLDEVSGTRVAWTNASACSLTESGGTISSEAGLSVNPGALTVRVPIPTDLPAEIAVDTITEKTPAAGVLVDGSKIKDGFFWPNPTSWPSAKFGVQSGFLYYMYDANTYLMYYVAQAKWYFVVGGANHFYVGATEISAYNKPIQSVTDPTNAQDAATKNYVDTKAGKVRSMYPVPVVTLVAAPTGQALPANNTTADLGVIMVPKPITVAKILYYANSGGGATSAVRIALYSEDGQTKYWDGPADVVGAGVGVRTITLVSPVTLKPGNYIILICHSVYATSAKNITRYVEDTDFEPHLANEPDMGGQVAIVGGAAPATIDPIAFGSVLPWKIPKVRFLGSAP